MFDFGGSTGRLPACFFLGAWCTLLCGEVFVWEQLGAGAMTVGEDVPLAVTDMLARPV